MLKIRRVTEGDIPAISYMCVDLHRESRFSDFPFSLKETSDFFHTCLESSDYVFFDLVEDDNLVVGFICGHIDGFFFNMDKLAIEDILYVVPDRRDGSISKILIKSFENWANSKSVRYVQLGVSTGINEGKIIAFYKRLGYYSCGQSVEKVL